MTHDGICLARLIVCFWMFTFHLDCFAGRICRRHWDFGWPRRGIDVARVLEEYVRLDVNEIGRIVPHVLSVVNDANHVVAAREQRSVIRKVEWGMLKYNVASKSIKLIAGCVKFCHPSDGNKLSLHYPKVNHFAFLSKEYKVGPSSQLLHDFPKQICSGCRSYVWWWL